MTMVTLSLVTAIVVAVSKFDLNSAVKTTVTSALLSTETAKIGSGTEEESSSLNDGSSPVYFNIFRFIGNLVPAGSSR